MATLTDSFTGSYAAFWQEWEEVPANTAIAVASNQLQVTASGASYAYEAAGLVTQTTYDFTAPANVNVDVNTNELGVFVGVSLTQIAATGENVYTDQADWLRCGNYGGSDYGQKKVAGSVTTEYSGAGGATGNFEVDFPTTGDDVRYKNDTSELGSTATYPFGSRDVYLFIDANTHDGYGYDLFYMDNFYALYTAAGGANAPTGQIHGCLYGPLGGVI